MVSAVTRVESHLIRAFLVQCIADGIVAASASLLLDPESTQKLVYRDKRVWRACTVTRGRCAVERRAELKRNDIPCCAPGESIIKVSGVCFIVHFPPPLSRRESKGVNTPSR